MDLEVHLVLLLGRDLKLIMRLPFKTFVSIAASQRLRLPVRKAGLSCSMNWRKIRFGLADLPFSRAAARVCRLLQELLGDEQLAIYICRLGFF